MDYEREVSSAFREHSSSWRDCHFQSIEQVRREAYLLRKQLRKELLAEEKRHAETVAVLCNCQQLERALQLRMEHCQSLIDNERSLLLNIEPLILRAEDVDPLMAEVYGDRGDVVRFYNGAWEWAEGSLKRTLKEAMTVSDGADTMLSQGLSVIIAVDERCHVLMALSYL